MGKNRSFLYVLSQLTHYGGQLKLEQMFCFLSSLIAGSSAHKLNFQTITYHQPIKNFKNAQTFKNPNNLATNHHYPIKIPLSYHLS